MKPVSICSKTLNCLCLFILSFFLQGFQASSLPGQATVRRSSLPAGAVVNPQAGGTGKESKYLEWAPKINAAFSDFRRGRKTAPAKVFSDFLRAEKKNPIPRKFLSEILLQQGKLEEARSVLGSTLRAKQADEIEPVPLTDWYVLAPFKYDGKKSFDAELKPEKEAFSSTA